MVHFFVLFAVGMKTVLFFSLFFPSSPLPYLRTQNIIRRHEGGEEREGRGEKEGEGRERRRERVRGERGEGGKGGRGGGKGVLLAWFVVIFVII